MRHFYFIVLFTTTLFSQEYIEIIRPDINIRMSPSTSSVIIGHAFSGEIYITNGETPKWYSVLLPSGETRWIYKKLTKKTAIISPSTQFVSGDGFSSDPLAAIAPGVDCLQVQEELKLASDQANKDANEESIGNLNKIEINNLLFDRYTLLTLQEYNISPVYYEWIMMYRHPSSGTRMAPVSEHLVSVTHIDYDLFQIDFSNNYIETRRCFKLGKNLDAMIFTYYESDVFIQKLCFEDGYGKGFNNCYNVKNTYESVLKEENLIVLTKEGKIKKTNLVLRESILKLSE